MTRHIVVAALVLGLAGGAYAETEKNAKAEKPAPEAKPARTQKASTEQPAEKTRQTPFGPVKATSEKPRPAAGLAADPYVSAKEEGELVIFSRKTPFGDQVWRKKKSELTGDEQALLARDKPAAAKTSPGESDAPAAEASQPEARRQP